MPSARVMVRLSGRWGLSGAEKELARNPIALDLPEHVTGEGLLQCLAERCGTSLRRKALKPDGKLRAEVRLFVNDTVVADPGAPLDDALIDGTEVSVVLLAPLIGG